MAYPEKYTRQYDFQAYQNANPNRPLPGDKVNVDLNAVEESVDQIVDFLKGHTRSDGLLKNGSVGTEQLADAGVTRAKLAPGIELGFDPPSPWAPDTAYTEGQSTVTYDQKLWTCIETHVSEATFNETKWELAIDFEALIGDALDLKADLASPEFTGNPRAPTPAPGDDSTAIPTTAWVQDEIAGFGGGTAADITFAPAGNVAATDVQAAIEEIDSEKASTGYVDAAIDAIKNGVSSAFDTLSEIATDLGLKMVKSANLSDVADAPTAFSNIKQAATDSATGVVELATTAEAVTGSDAVRAVTPAGLTARMGAPGAIGGTTPAAGAFTTLNVSGLLTAAGGQIAFPASPNASSDANTLDEYEEGTWTPTLTFATPGDLSVSYDATRGGVYVKIGRCVMAHFSMLTSSFTHTTASGALQVTGFPFTSSDFAGLGVGQRFGALEWGGVTKTNYTQISCTVNVSATTAIFFASGSGQAASQVTAADMPTGGQVRLRGGGTYQSAA